MLSIALLSLGCHSTDPGESGADSDVADTDTDADTDSDTDTDTDTDTDADTDTTPTGPPADWLYTEGNGIYVSDGHSGTRWMGRGVNADDLFLCGYNNTLWMSSDGEDTLDTELMGLVADWKPSFVRVSLGMDSYPTTPSWTSQPAQYSAPMTRVIEDLTDHGVYVLVALRSDRSMILEDEQHGDPEATGIPSDASTTPDSDAFPTGTDATYVALVDSFADNPRVLFGITNEPGGNLRSDEVIAAAMTHAVATIRAEEDRLGVPHHLVSVQGNDWTSDISYYASNPVPQDDVLYEVHGYPPSARSYTYADLPVIIGEYGSLGDPDAFFADLETKQIPNLAWDFEAYSDCSPDLLVVTHDATDLRPTAWGDTVQAYLLAHAP
jgi:hypothetical protein